MDAFSEGFVGEPGAVQQHVFREGVEIFGHHEVASVDESARAGGKGEGDAGARTNAEPGTREDVGVVFRNEMEVGPGGRQVQIEDPDGNPVELFEPAQRS